jgi:hypothetical protein
MISSTINLSGHSIGAPAQRNFCGFNGFATQWFVTQCRCNTLLTRLVKPCLTLLIIKLTHIVIADYWILIIAICTFLLVGDYQKGSDWVQKHRLLLWCLPWGVSGLWAAIGLGVIGYGNIGACKCCLFSTLPIFQFRCCPLRTCATTNPTKGAGSPQTRQVSSLISSLDG